MIIPIFNGGLTPVSALTDTPSSSDAETQDAYLAKNQVLLSLATASTDQKITVKVNGAGSQSTEEIGLGKFADKVTPVLTADGKNYQFVEARFNNAVINAVYYDEGTGVYYTTTSDDNITGTVISSDDLKNITLYYEQIVNTYTVTYKVMVDGVAVTSYDAILEKSGSSTVKDGHDYSFTLTPEKGYELSGVTYTMGSNTTATSLTGTENQYIIQSVNGNITINVNLTETTSYDISFSGSNTVYKVDGTYTNSGSAYSYTSESGGTGTVAYKAANKLEFVLHAGQQWSTNQKVLNKLTLTVDGTVTMVEIPDTGGASATTTLSDGTTVVVTKSSGSETYGPYYTVTLTAPAGQKVRGTIAVDTNYKDDGTSEVWAKQLEGVEALPYYVSGKGLIDAVGQGDQKSRLDPSIFVFFDRTNYTSKVSYYFVKLKTGYDFSKLSLEVRNYDDTKGTYSVVSGPVLTSITSLSDTAIGKTNKTRLVNEGYGYYFTIPANSSSQTLTDLRIFISYTPDTATYYTANYNYQGGTFNSDTQETDSNQYNDGNSIAISDTVPVKDGYVFQGWTLDGDTSGKVYQAGDLFTINSSSELLADSSKIFHFSAKWVEKSAAVNATYTVKVFYADDNGEYLETANLSVKQLGPVDQTVYIIDAKFKEYLASHKDSIPDDYLSYVIDKEDNSTVVKADGSTVVSVYYTKLHDLSYDANTGTGNVPDTKTYKKGTVVSVDFGTLPTKENYLFIGWDVDPNATNATYTTANNKLTMPYKNVKLYAIWQRNTNKLTISKSVTGNMGDHDLAYNFSLTIKDGTASYNNNALTPETGSMQSSWSAAGSANGAYTFSLKDGQKIVLTLPQGVTYTVSETAAEGYTTTYTVNSDPKVITGTSYNEATGLKSDTTVAFDNDREVVPPSGIVSENTPYVLMTGIVLAAGAWFVWDRRRRNRKAA